MSDRSPARPESLRLAYADPPYPGMAYLYQEKTEVDHVELLAQLGEYDGWALSTDERSLAFVLSLCPPKTRVCAWAKLSCPPLRPNPYAAWEPVLVKPARIEPVLTGSAFRSAITTDKTRRGVLVGSKPREFCEWVFRCIGATADDTLDDLFPGTGAVGEAWESYRNQTRLPMANTRGQGDRVGRNMLRRFADPLPGFEGNAHVRERPNPPRREA